jgi:hypothetical protein
VVTFPITRQPSITKVGRERQDTGPRVDDSVQWQAVTGQADGHGVAPRTRADYHVPWGPESPFGFRAGGMEGDHLTGHADDVAPGGETIRDLQGRRALAEAAGQAAR